MSGAPSTMTRMVVRLPTVLTRPPEMVRINAGLAAQLAMLRLNVVLS